MAPATPRDEALEWPYERLSATRGILMDFVVDQVRTPDGALVVRNYLQHPVAVGIIALDDEGRVAVERQYRHPVRRKLVEAPAGLCDLEGETWLEAAQRELAEELGLAAQRWSILVDIFATPGSSTQRTRVFLAQGLSTVARPDGFELEGEEADMWTGWVPLEELVDAIFAGDIMNPTLVTGIMALRTAQLGRGLDSLRQP